MRVSSRLLLSWVATAVCRPQAALYPLRVYQATIIYAALQARYSTRPRVRTFYEIWNRPLMTINGEHLISDVIRLCGGENVFARLPVLAPTIDTEAVLAAAPEVIVASGMGEARPEWLDDWRQWTKLQAVSRGNLFFIPPDQIQRHTPRILDGAERLCGQLEEARSRR